MSTTSGWGRLDWNQGYWGNATRVWSGWGAKSWNDGAWGTMADETVELTAPDSMSALSGPNAWGYNAWGHGAWESYTINYAIGEVPTGVSATASVGSPNINYSSTQIPTGVSATASLGSLSINNGADHVQGLSGQSATASVGSHGFAWIEFPTGVSATTSVGSITIASVELIDVT